MRKRRGWAPAETGGGGVIERGEAEIRRGKAPGGEEDGEGRP